MYERFEPSERIFVDREEYLEWMDKALARCKEKSVVLHLKGIGGIGKSSLLDHWTSTLEFTIRVDCEQYSEFYQRLNILAKGAVLQGVNLKRFDVLWQIRQRFVEGVEPVREEGRQWAKDVFVAIPFIGTLTIIGSALSAIGSKVTPKLKGKFSTVGKWLQERLGKNHIEKLLEILWKEPHHAEFLYLDALLEDINNRSNSESPLLFLMDHFEQVDSEKAQWRYGGRLITETELWNVFLCSLSNSVGVMASRKAAIAQLKDQVEESELGELDAESSNEFLRLRKISDFKLQDKIVKVSRGNPFVIGSICDLVDTGDISFKDIEGLGADTLEEVRIKTWRRLFNEAYDLTPLIDRAGLLPFFTRRVMNIIAPDMKAEQWNRLIRLSFIRNRGNETYVLHELAEDLIIAELGDRMQQLCVDVATKLEEVSKNESDLILLGLAISALAKADPRKAIEKTALEFTTQIATQASATVAEFLAMLEMLQIDTIEAELEIQDWRGYCLFQLGRFAECEYILSDTLEVARELAVNKPDDHRMQAVVARILYHLAGLYARLGRGKEAEEFYIEGISILTDLHERSILQNVGPEPGPIVFAWGIHWQYGIFLNDENRPMEAEKILQRAYEFSKELPESDSLWNRETIGNLVTSTLASVQISIGKPLDAERISRTIVNAKSFQHWDPVFKANILGHLCRALRKTNRLYDAEEILQKARDTWMILYEKEPSVEWTQIVNYSLVLGKLMMQTGRITEAEKIFNECLELTKKYTVEDDPYILAFVQSHIGVLLSELGSFSDAVKTHETALKIFRTMVEKSPTFHRGYVADSLNNYAIVLRKIGKLKDAKKSYREALEMSRALSEDDPENVESQNRVASVLTNYGVLLRTLDEFKEAEKLLNEAFEIRKKLVEISPEMFNKHLAWTLNSLGMLFLETERHSESLRYFNNALHLLRNLASKTEDIFIPDLATVINNLSIQHQKLGEKEESEKASSELTKIKRILVKKDVRVYQDRFTLDKTEDFEEFLIDF